MTVPPHKSRNMPPADRPKRRILWTTLVAGGIVAITIAVLRFEGRRWWCACESLALWTGDTTSAHCSQHLFDPYALTHMLHGMAFCGILALFGSRLSSSLSFSLTLALEALWEVVENSAFVIDRYRTATMALGYEGDSIANSVGDIGACAFGWWLAKRLGWRWSIAVWLAVEVILLFWIRDNLLLNVVMLVWPIDALKQWQMQL